MRETIYVCTACGLKLEIGWSHGLPPGQDEPLKWYGSRTRLICKECGAQYKIEMPRPYRESAYIQLYDVILESYESQSKLALMKLLRKQKSFGLKEAKDIIENPPYTIDCGIPKEDTSYWENAFKEISVKVKLKKSMHMPLKDCGSLLPDRLLGTNRQVFLKGLPKKSPENYDHSDYEAAGAIIDQHRGDNLDEWHEINPIETKNNKILLSKQPCQICLTVGKIGADIRNGDVCPHCKEKTLLSVLSIVT